jgi:L-aspartate oxidase
VIRPPQWPGGAAPERIRADLVIVGSGVAGLSAALAASESPRAEALRIVLITPGRIGLDGASALAQGGIAAALDPSDSPALHALDTRQAGAGLTVEERVQWLAADGPDRVRELERLGVRFDRDADGSLALGLEGAHSRRRIVHALGDRTGWEVSRVLAEAVLRRPGIRILEGWTATDLLLEGDAHPRFEASGGPRRVAGIAMRDGNDRRADLRAPIVLLATGGAGRLYLRSTVSPFAMGDGLAMAARAGAHLDGMEFVQFHPTALRVDADPLPLVTEALRGEGAILVDGRGRPVVTGDAPGRGGLASRDRVARLLWSRMEAGDEVFLDAREAVGSDLARRFPGVYAHCREHGIDPVREPIPVTPAAHYQMGGIAVDADGRSTLPGLRAAGEVASTGVHGANRLASNSLLEGLVYGRRAGHAARRDLQAGRSAGTNGEARWTAPTAPAAQTGPAAPAAPSAWKRGRPAADTQRSGADLLLALRTLLWEGAGVIRSQYGLRRTLDGLDGIEREAQAAGGATEARLRGPTLVARAIAQAALDRPCSVGSHFRSDEVLEAASAVPAQRVS